jgi:hypothetical protein
LLDTDRRPMMSEIHSREIAMTVTLEQFCGEMREILKAQGQQGLPEIADRLKSLLTDESFVRATWDESMKPGKRVLFHDAETDAYVLAHVQEGGKGGHPHSHGASWAIYGNAKGFTDMVEWRRVNAESEEQAVLEASDKYRIGPGQSHAYGAGVIHSTAHPEKAWVIRITGGDLDQVPRFRFHPHNDKILEKT